MAPNHDIAQPAKDMYNIGDHILSYRYALYIIINVLVDVCCTGSTCAFLERIWFSANQRQLAIYNVIILHFICASRACCNANGKASNDNVATRRSTVINNICIRDIVNDDTLSIAIQCFPLVWAEEVQLHNSLSIEISKLDEKILFFKLSTIPSFLYHIPTTFK